MQLALVSAFAGLALAGPLGARQETLKPFKQPAFGSSKKCGVSQMINDHNTRKWKSEDCQGTLLYCRRKFFQESNEKFESTEECLGSREPAPSSTKPDDYNPTNSVEPGSPVIQTKPTRDELAGAPVTQQRILEIIGHQNIACEEEEKKKIYCTASRKEEQVAVKDGLSPLCKEKGGCEECRMGTVNGFETDFTCAVGLSSKNQKQDLAEGLVFSD
ncbi:hypothetical protein VB005_03493 [Metarhizium brunneum]